MERECNGSSTFILNTAENNEHEDHLQFLQTIIQLKSTLKIGSSLPLNEFKEIILSFPHQCKETLDISSLFNENDSEETTRNFESQDLNDSGIGSSATQDSTNENVSPTTIAYVIRSSTIANHIYQSVTAVMNYLFSCLFCGNEQSLKRYINNWKGSLIEMAVNVLVELMDLVSCREDHDYYKTYSDFIARIINCIYVTKDIKTFSMLENQCVIINELSNSQCLCEVAINSIMKRIEGTFVKMKTGSLNTQTLQTIEKATICSDEYDTSFFMLLLLEKLLKKWCVHCTVSTQKEQYKRTYTNITEIWKESWGSNGNSRCERTKLKALHEEWSNILEEAVNVMEEYPNYSFLIWTCLQILESQNEFKD